MPGVATGLAWTPVGGDVLFIEATAMPGKSGFKYTGQLGDVMKESAQIALSYVRAYTKELGIDSKYFEEHDIHLHVPAGATPKDGPSAGITMAMALASMLTQRPTRSDVAMTGELTLGGQVLPVGGIKDKVLAAHRIGVKKVILPRKNAKDLDDLPDDIREDLEFVLVEHMDTVLEHALVAKSDA
jgi:ATP-dependent Lon protease